MLALEAAPDAERALVAIAPPPPITSSDTHPSPDASPSPDAVAPHVPETTTLADLSQDVSNWTLHSDHSLHTFLKRYSSDLFVRTKALEDRVRDIAADADAAYVRLKNTLNQFLLLSNNQFMENRVYDEEQEDFYSLETSSGDKLEPDKRDKGRDETGAAAATSTTLATTTSASASALVDKEGGAKAAAESIVTKYRSALDMGMEAMKLFVMMDDEDEDEANDDANKETSSPFETVLDIYNERPLPFIIGTREFLEDETLGLGAAPEEYSESDSDGSDPSSYSSSGSESDSAASDASSISKRSLSRSRNRSSSEESERLSAASRERSTSDESEMSGLFGRPPVVKPSRRRADSDESDTRGLFGRPPAPGSTVPQPGTTIPRARRALYSDSSSDEDEDGAGLFGASTAPPVSAPRSQPVHRAPQSGLFGESESDDSDDSDASEVFGANESAATRASSAAAKPPPVVARRPAPRVTRAVSGSDSDDDDDDDDKDDGLFGTSRVAKPPAAAPVFLAPTQTRQSRVLSDSSDSDGGDVSARQLQPVHRAPQGGLFDEGDSDDSDDSDASGLFGANKSAAARASPAVAKPPLVVAPKLAPAVALDASESNSDDDDDDEDDGLFGIPQVAKTPAAVPAVARPTQARQSRVLSDSSESDGGDLFGATPSQPASTLMPQPALMSAPKPAMATSVLPAAPRSNQRHSSDDDSDDWSDDDGGFFGAPTSAPISASSPAVATSVPLGKPSINRQNSSDDDSDDWSDEDGGLFGVAKSKPADAQSVGAPVQAGTSTPSSVPMQAKALSESPFGLLAGASVPTAGLPISNAAARMRAVESDSDSDSDSDWDGDGGLFGPPKN
uniref:WASH complex subunit FAM21 n=1 Tax=Hyaloperonospora arabidopsidis (strain Emoy2) TaxID=559515 RepID=M4BJ66_HYAAE